MNRLLLLMFGLVSLMMAACSTTAPGSRLMGYPEEPYGLKEPPKIGQIVHLPTGVLVSLDQMLEMAGDSRIIYVGETHDNPASHRLQLQALHALAKRYPDGLALGMEMFSRSQQPILDRWNAGTMTEKEFIKESRWFENWRMDYNFYRDLISFARSRNIPIIALDAEKPLVRAVRINDPEKLSPEELAALPELDQNDPYYRALLSAVLGDVSHGGMSLDGFIRAHTVRDETMAESIVRYLTSPPGKDKHLVVVAGGDHVSFGFGIPRRVFRRLPVSYTLIGSKELDIAEDKKDRIMNITVPDFPMVPYDFLAFLGYEDLPETGVKLGVMGEAAPGGRGVLVKKMLAGSNAERAGLREGDTILEFDRQLMKEPLDLIYAVQEKKAGDRVVIEIERLGAAMKLEVVMQEADKK